jgi:putative lipoic acid-binding regulatory protein
VHQDEEVIAGVLGALARQAGLEHLDDRHERVLSRKGRYVSLRVRVPVRDASEVLALYEVLGRMEGLLSYF